MLYFGMRRRRYQLIVIREVRANLSKVHLTQHSSLYSFAPRQITFFTLGMRELGVSSERYALMRVHKRVKRCSVE